MGLLPGRSTTDVVLSATHDWHQTLDNGSKVCATIFDLHAGSISLTVHVLHLSLILQNCMRQLDINEFLLKQVVDYLTDRSHTSKKD